MTDVAVAPDAGAASAGLSEGQRIIGTFSAPYSTAPDMKRNASFWLPFLIICLVAISFNLTMKSRIGIDQAVETMKANMSDTVKERIEQAPPEQKAKIEADMDRRMKDGLKNGYWQAPIFILIFGAIQAAVLLASFNFLLGGQVTFKSAFAWTMYSSLVLQVKYLLAIALMFVADPASFYLANPVATNLGSLVSPSGSPGLYAALSSLDIIVFWHMIVLGLGLAAIGKVSKGAGVAVIIGWWVVITLLRVAMAALLGVQV